VARGPLVVLPDVDQQREAGVDQPGGLVDLDLFDVEALRPRGG